MVQVVNAEFVRDVLLTVSGASAALAEPTHNDYEFGGHEETDLDVDAAKSRDRKRKATVPAAGERNVDHKSSSKHSRKKSHSKEKSNSKPALKAKRLRGSGLRGSTGRPKGKSSTSMLVATSIEKAVDMMARVSLRVVVC